MIPVILSGGSGTRLWPLSRTKLPKQFCDIFGASLHTLTVQRLLKLNQPWIVTSESLRDLTLREGKALGLNKTQFIFEPMARNTAPAIALLCHILKKNGLSSSVIGVFPADHLIEKELNFLAALELASQEAEAGHIVTLGIQPTFPATGYGYIQIDQTDGQPAHGISSYAVKKFHEKPNLETARSFIEARNYFWNAGIFVFRVDEMIKAFIKHQPQIWNAINNLRDDLSNLRAVYESLEGISVDYAIMEKLERDKLTCIPCDIGWSDVGSWDAISEILGSTKNPNVQVRSENNFVFSNLEKKYAFIDSKDLLVIDTKDALLISKKGSSQMVKDVYESMSMDFPKLVTDHVFEYRPWGQYEILKDTEVFKSKVIEVLPHEQLSYQSHTKREEHWIVTRGEGEVVLNDAIVPVKKGSYVKIPLGSKHRMRNTGAEVLEFIEVQLGSYFGEDDITRYQDDYQRQ